MLRLFKLLIDACKHRLAGKPVAESRVELHNLDKEKLQLLIDDINTL